MVSLIAYNLLTESTILMFSDGPERIIHQKEIIQNVWTPVIPCIFHVSYASVPHNTFYLFSGQDRQLHGRWRILLCQEKGKGYLRQHPCILGWSVELQICSRANKHNYIQTTLGQWRFSVMIVLHIAYYRCLMCCSGLQYLELSKEMALTCPHWRNSDCSCL